MTGPPPRHGAGAATRPAVAPLDLAGIREHFDFPGLGRIVTNNAATTQPPRELAELYRTLTPWYENVHRGQSTASRRTTAMFEDSFDTIAAWINAPSKECIVPVRNTTEAINAVMYSLQTEFRDGDNVVTTDLEHNSNFVPWYALSTEILPRFGRRVQCRVARFQHADGSLDVDHLAHLVDERTKLVCVTGASNFLGTKPPLPAVRAVADASGYVQPWGQVGSLLLVDAAQLAPSSSTDVRELDVDYLAFSFHKILAPFGVGVLYAKRHLLDRSLPFLYGGDMVAEGRVAADHVDYNDLPWKYVAGTPNIIGLIASAQALRLIVDLVADRSVVRSGFFGADGPIPRGAVTAVMDRVAVHCRAITERALTAAQAIPGLTVYGPPAGVARSPLLSFNLADTDPRRLATELNDLGVESRAGCHCATLAHRALGLTPPASCRLSFALYTSEGDVDRALDAVRSVALRRARSWTTPPLRAPAPPPGATALRGAAPVRG